MTNQPTGTVTLLFTDIVGSTQLAQQQPDTWRQLQERHHAILRSAIDAHNGYVFQIIGDAFCAAFATAGEALRASIKAQIDLHAEDWGPAPIKVRMGLHTGQAELQPTGEYIGYLTLSHVQRLMSVAHGGQVLISATTQELVRDALPKEISLRDLGERRLKDLARPEHIFQLLIPTLPGNFAPLKTPEVFPTNLPVQLTSFVGREKELTEVKKLLHDAHLLTLTGSGGTGKTRLSIQAASELLDQYPDGVWLVEFAPILDPLLVPRTTAMAVGLREESMRPVIDMLCDYVREKKMLIILDNCEHLVEACAHLADRLLHASAHTRLLASSREALGIAGEVTYHVPSLRSPDLDHLPSVDTLNQYEAVKLFIDRAISAVPTFTVTDDNAPFLAQICHRLDGIPLAIELAAAKIRVLSVEQIARRLDDRFRLLTGGSRTALERHQTLRATLDWSYNLLPPAEQILLRRLSIFVKGWTLEAAEYVCSDESTSGEIRSADVLNLLEHLVNKSLVPAEEWHNETRYHMLETINQYGFEKLKAAGETDRIRDRHLEFFVKMAEENEPHLYAAEQVEWFARAEAEIDNLRAALDWSTTATQTGDDERIRNGLRLASVWFWVWQRDFSLEFSKRLRYMLSQENAGAQTIERARALLAAGYLHLILNKFSEARLYLVEALEIGRKYGDKLTLAWTLGYLGFILTISGEHDKAQLFLEECITITAGLGNIGKSISGFAHSFIADLYLLNKDAARAQENYEEGIRLLRETHNADILAYTVRRLGYLVLKQAEHERARNLFRESLIYNHEVNHQVGIIASIVALANLALAERDAERAAQLFGKVENRLVAIGFPLYFVDQVEHDSGLSTLRAQMDEKILAKFWAKGAALTLDEAILFALDTHGEQKE